MSNSKSSGAVIGCGGVSFTSLLCLLFVALKLTGFIDWSWWWVTSPLWIPIVAPTVVTLAVLAVALCVAIVVLILFAIVCIFDL